MEEGISVDGGGGGIMQMILLHDTLHRVYYTQTQNWPQITLTISALQYTVRVYVVSRLLFRTVINYHPFDHYVVPFQI